MAIDGGNGDITTVAVRSPSHHRGIKEARVSSDGVDSISSLPDVILQHIFSFMPTRFAIRTSVLSKRWKHIWTDTPSLDFDFGNIRKKPNADSVNKTLTLYTAHKVMAFSLRINEKMLHIDGLIRFVMSRNVETMSLYLFFDTYKIPDFFYTNSSLKQLTLSLNFCEIKIPMSCSVSWTSLKKLSLGYCHFSCECIDKILSGCPVLESLKWYCCNRRLIMKVLDLSKSLRLRSLEIDQCGCVDFGTVEIVAPQIHYLNLTNSECILVDVSSLTEARLDFYIWSIGDFGGSKADLHLLSMLLKMLEKLHNVEKLTFGANFVKILSLDEFRSVLFPSLKVKDLRLETMVNQDVIHGLVKLLQNSPELKKLTVHGTIPEEYRDKLLGFARLEIRSGNKGL